MSNKNPENQFKKGKSGNPKGRPSAGMSLTQLMKEHLEKIPEGSEISYKEAFISKVFARAYEGNDAYVKLVWNYVEGMPVQSVDVTSKGKQIGSLNTEEAIDRLREIEQESTTQGTDILS